MLSDCKIKLVLASFSSRLLERVNCGVLVETQVFTLSRVACMLAPHPAARQHNITLLSTRDGVSQVAGLVIWQEGIMAWALLFDGEYAGGASSDDCGIGGVLVGKLLVHYCRGGR